jgi:hypothetical protein
MVMCQRVAFKDMYWGVMLVGNSCVAVLVSLNAYVAAKLRENADGLNELLYAATYLGFFHPIVSGCHIEDTLTGTERQSLTCPVCHGIVAIQTAACKSFAEMKTVWEHFHCKFCMMVLCKFLLALLATGFGVNYGKRCLLDLLLWPVKPIKASLLCFGRFHGLGMLYNE